jgi:hypothetical protein
MTCDRRRRGEASKPAEDDGADVAGRTCERHKRPEELKGGECAGTRLGLSGSDAPIPVEGG